MDTSVVSTSTTVSISRLRENLLAVEALLAFAGVVLWRRILLNVLYMTKTGQV
jgi:hypothetical protein